MRARSAGIIACLSLAPAALASVAGYTAESERPYTVTEEREECESFDPLRRPFFGDTHVHTAYSFDASTQDTRATPRDAYRFARGEPLGIQPYAEDGTPSRTVRLDRPLDFVAVSDHAELLGEVNLCTTPGTLRYWHPVCFTHRNFPRLGMMLIAYTGTILKSRWDTLCGDDGEACEAGSLEFWQEIQDAAEEAYDRSSRCSFTSFVGYEWTASVGPGKNLHRNVIFRNEKVPHLPVNWIDTPSAFDLWQSLQAKCLDGLPGCDVLTIPHNSNLSGGLIFETARISDAEVPGPIDTEEARLRSRWEPLVEIMQHKGSSECDLRAGWSNDESCGFEKLPYDNFGGKNSFLVERQLPSESNFVRYALKQGLLQQRELGANAFRYGIIASTDTHIAAPGLTKEQDHPGHGGAGLAANEIATEGLPDDIEFGPGGLAVLWAEENTRDALFAAMQRREAYGTSGTRPIVRFFGGWNYPENLCEDPGFVAKGYADGVPMGGELGPGDPANRMRAPRFAVWAMQDPGTANDAGAPLERIQVIKGWLDGDEAHERVIDVAGGKNDAGVDLATCERHGSGASNLCTVWVDPDFDPTVPSFYYARVLENPSCRWSQYACNAAGVDCRNPDSVPEPLAVCCSSEYPATIQERAWTSPIWYTP